MKKVIIKDAEKAEEYGFSKRHIICSDDEFDRYEKKVGCNDVHFYLNSAADSDIDGTLFIEPGSGINHAIAEIAELVRLGIAEVVEDD